MDEAKQNDKTHRGPTGPPRIPKADEGEITDIVCATGHAYQMVHSQEPTWMFYLRLTSIGGNYTGIIRIVLRPEFGGGAIYWTGDAKYFPRKGEDGRLI